ncbi:hypothetical protein WA026_012203 [Henosepilachna vigintioctopunctata]|uniref:Protein kinase domain-containing protein n=1 Tax=Henosepilachna vigintioctopunctata TaxID=420089 RepID=A0AAW1V6V8_9CUCU
MVVGEPSINNIMSGIENTGGVKQHNHRKKLKQRFDLIKKLGQGTFGKVQLGINKETGQEVAIKTIKKSKIESEADLVRIRREIQIMSSVQHPNIIHIYEVFENREKMVLVMEYAAGGELYDYLSERKVLTEDEARRIFRQIATACYYCHKHKICHRDLKLENILLDENNNAKIADFGLSNVFDDQRLLNTFCGSPLYASPEIVKGTPYHGPEVDCWSLGVLLYTLVYGAMPFDGSNFKRLVKQISQGDYFEPAKPSPASPLIRDMLTVNPKHRANIEQICSHWWVNENYEENCLEISEDLANQTPVRLDLLLSLAPPPPQLESDKLVVTEDATEDAAKAEASAPTRSQSVGSLMELSHPAERRIKEMLLEEKSPKRKLESTVSTDRVNLDKGLKRKDKIIKENTVADITVHSGIHEVGEMDDSNMSESSLHKSLTQTLSRDMEVEQMEDLSVEGAACSEIMEEVNKKSIKEPSRLKRNLTTTLSTKLENINETPSQESVISSINKENEEIETVAQEIKPEEKVEETPEPKTAKKKIIRKKVLTDRNENAKEKEKSKSPQPTDKIENEVQVEEQINKENQEEIVEVPTKPVERRRSRIFEAAEKFQNMITPAETPKTPVEKPKKIIIPGVSVDGFKKEFERKASLTSSAVPKLKSDPSKKAVNADKQKSDESGSKPSPSQMAEEKKISKENKDTVEDKEESNENSKAVINDDRKEKVRNAVSIISSALDKEGARKSKSRPCMMRKPPVPFGVSGRSASGNIGMLSSNLMAPVAPKPFVRPQFDKVEPHKIEEPPPDNQDDKISSAEITLKSATLPRRKTSKAEIQLNYPIPKPATMEFMTEVAHPVQAHPKLSTQRSEVVVPITGQPTVNFRASSLEPESVMKPRERIIPISFEKIETNREPQGPQSPPAKPPTPKVYQTQRSNVSQRTSSLSRQSTQDSDTETITSTGDPIKKSPREYIIPIAIEGGGYVTPRAGSLEPTDSTNNASISSSRVKSSFGKPKRFNSRLSDRDSEDESPFTNLHRHSSFGKDSDTEDSRRDAFHMHRLRSTRPKKATMEHADSISSGEDDDDDGFDILTAENLFSTLLSRVKDLTQRLNVEDGGRPGFPSSRLLSHFDHGTNFWNMHNRLDPFSRHSSLSRTFGRERAADPNRSFNTPWRRSVSKDLASDIDSVMRGDTPISDKNTKKENLNLADIDLKKLNLSEEESMALSYLTPALTRRMQKQLLAQLAPSEVRKLHRTLSSRNSSDNNPYEPHRNTSNLFSRRSVDRLSSTLPRKYSNDKINSSADAKLLLDLEKNREVENEKTKSFLPVKSSKNERRLSFRDSRISDGDMTIRGLRSTRSASNREPRTSYKTDTNPVCSPDSSLSESLSSFARDPDSISEISSRAFSTDSYNSLSRPSSYSKTEDVSSRYFRPNKSYESPQSVIPNSNEFAKTDAKKPSSSTKRISRFLRPDFFDQPKEENVVVKEKKEREMETQKVLKEIRDKRKERLSMRRERSVPKEELSNCDTSDRGEDSFTVTSSSFRNSDESSLTIPEYVNVTNKPVFDNKILENSTILPQNVAVASNTIDKKSRISKLARPKSYPAESSSKQTSRIPEKTKTSPEKESKISKLRKGFVRKEYKEKSKDDKNATNKNINEEEKVHKNKLLHSIEKKLEKFRSSPDKIKENSAVENTIRRLREQSLPKNLDHCTESGLIKRAVSVEDLSNIQHTDKPLQASRKSVTKILGLFKKYEDSDNKKNDKMVRKKKIKSKTESKSTPNASESDCNVKVANEEIKVEGDCIDSEAPKINKDDKLTEDSKNAATNKEQRSRLSKLPVNSFRRSLNLDTVTQDTPKIVKTSTKSEAEHEKKDVEKPDKESLRLDFSRIRGSKTEPGISENMPSTSYEYGHGLDRKRNSFVTPRDVAHFLSPSDDVSCDSWSICSDAHSPVSPNGHLYSGDESESVIDRIRRKSFYTRFNEKKKPHTKTYMKSYRDLDLYKDLGLRAPHNYGSLDRRNTNYDKFDRVISHPAAVSQQKEYKPYVRNASVLNDYVNVSGQYQPYCSKNSYPSSLYSDSESTLDEDNSAAKFRRNSSLSKPSTFYRTPSKSPSIEGIHIEAPTSSILPNSATLTKLH